MEVAPREFLRGPWIALSAPVRFDAPPPAFKRGLRDGFETRARFAPAPDAGATSPRVADALVEAAWARQANTIVLPDRDGTGATRLRLEATRVTVRIGRVGARWTAGPFTWGLETAPLGVDDARARLGTYAVRSHAWSPSASAAAELRAGWTVVETGLEHARRVVEFGRVEKAGSTRAFLPWSETRAHALVGVSVPLGGSAWAVRADLGVAAWRVDGAPSAGRVDVQALVRFGVPFPNDP